ncbi:unnamed protein product [Lepeophtheirus salmonis]|uniref:(salmon louse) hypothetical protein n=1 Tax=Lepeophtheirus salmonis TaxID=72036 RepID=A0A7R8CT72_LEPSM|nr:unnamed protein product [Lepeophtheirus salmonis]CAF2923508.1 unnamed protein product [Lepeophtheirus salmonis]
MVKLISDIWPKSRPSLYSRSLVKRREGYKSVCNKYSDPMRQNRDPMSPKKMLFLDFLIMPFRHPLERIISVYRAEFEENINVVTKEKTPARMSFPDFIELVVKGPELMMEYKQQMAKKGQSLAADMGLIDGKGLSSLWNSYWNQCGLCHPLFDPEYIIHLETFKEDFKVLNIDVMNSNQNIDKILNIKEDESGNHSSSELDIIEFYYSQLKKKGHTSSL